MRKGLLCHSRSTAHPRQHASVCQQCLISFTWPCLCFCLGGSACCVSQWPDLSGWSTVSLVLLSQSISDEKTKGYVEFLLRKWRNWYGDNSFWKDPILFWQLSNKCSILKIFSFHKKKWNYFSPVIFLNRTGIVFLQLDFFNEIACYYLMSYIGQLLYDFIL